MQIGQIALKIRLADTRFNNRVFGAAELALALEYTLKKESAFIIPLAETAKANNMDSGINQTITERFAIVVAIDNGSSDRDKVGLVKKLILEQLERLKKISEKDLGEAKDFVEGDYLLDVEDNQKLADNLCFWEQMGKAKLMEEFIRKVKKVKRSDVRRVVEKYFKNYCLAVVEGK